MASSNFDELAKALANSTSRRQTIRVLFVSVLGGVLGLGGIGTPQAEGWSGVGAPGNDCTTGGVCGANNDNVSIWKSIQNCVQNNICTKGVVDHTRQWVLYQEGTEGLHKNYTLFAGQRIKGMSALRSGSTRIQITGNLHGMQPRTICPTRTELGWRLIRRPLAPSANCISMFLVSSQMCRSNLTLITMTMTKSLGIRRTGKIIHCH